MKKKVKIPLSTKFALTYVPLLLFVMLMTIYAVHRTVTLQFTDRYERELQASSEAIDRDMYRKLEVLRRQLQQLAAQIRDDHEFRLHVSVLGDFQHSYIVDYAPRHMATMGLHALEITDANGNILSSGQFRNAFGGNVSGLLRNIREAGDDIVLAWFDHPDGYILCLTAIESFSIGNRSFNITGGIQVDEDFLRSLQSNTQNVLLLRTPTRYLSSNPSHIDASVLDELGSENGDTFLPDWLHENYSFSRLTLSVADRNRLAEGGVYLLHSRYELIRLLSTLNEKIIAITVVGIIFGIILAFWQAGNVARPLERLARRASNISLDSLEDNFNIKSNDEVGVVNNAMKDMVQRLRKSRLDLAIAEQKAAFAEIARKVNHDIKNGFIPIRNVMQHWGEVADRDPDSLPKVFKERRETIDESIKYLQDLARNYARSHRKVELEPVNLNKVVGSILRNYTGLSGDNITIESNLIQEELYVAAEYSQLRRAIENIVLNAVEACGEQGEIIVTTEKKEDSVSISIKDNGKGIPAEVREKLFTTHITTKPDGTGIGLMNANTIMKELGGTITIEDREPGGTVVTLSLPEMHPDATAGETINEEAVL